MGGQTVGEVTRDCGHGEFVYDLEMCDICVLKKLSAENSSTRTRALPSATDSFQETARAYR